jgi:hypothetical protein
MTVITCIEDAARAGETACAADVLRLRRFGLVNTESTSRANASDFGRTQLRQRVAVNMDSHSRATKVVGIDVNMPVASVLRRRTLALTPPP